MNRFLTVLITFLFHAPLGFVNALSARPALFLANGSETTNKDSRSFKTDAVISTRHLLYKPGSDSEHIVVNTAAVCPLGTVPDEADAAEIDIEVRLLGIYDGTLIMVASGVITADAEVYTDAAGKVQAEPTVAGTYFRVGKALTAAAADGDRIEVQHHKPIKVVVMAAFTAGTTAAGSDAATTQALANAIKVDLAAIRTALAAPAELKVL